MRATLDFFLNDWLRVGDLRAGQALPITASRPFRCGAGYRRKIAKSKYAPFNRLVDSERAAHRHRTGRHAACGAAAGDARSVVRIRRVRMLSAALGLRLGRHAVAVHGWSGGERDFQQGLGPSISWAMLTTGNANLLMAHGTAAAEGRICKERICGPLDGHYVLVRAAGGIVSVRYRDAPSWRTKLTRSARATG